MFRTFSTMPYQQISEETKRHIIVSYEGDEDYVLMARLLNISRQAAWQLVRRFLNDGQVVWPHGGARAQVTRADEEMMAVAVDIVTDHPAYMLRQINDDLHQRLPNSHKSVWQLWLTCWKVN